MDGSFGGILPTEDHIHYSALGVESSSGVYTSEARLLSVVGWLWSETYLSGTGGCEDLAWTAPDVVFGDVATSGSRDAGDWSCPALNLAEAAFLLYLTFKSLAVCVARCLDRDPVMVMERRSTVGGLYYIASLIVSVKEYSRDSVGTADAEPVLTGVEICFE